MKYLCDTVQFISEITNKKFGEHIKNFVLVFFSCFKLVVLWQLSLSLFSSQKIMNMKENQPFACYFLKTVEFNCLYFCPHFYKAFLKNISIRVSWKFRRSSFVLQAVPEREYSKICLFYITPFPTLIFGSQENFDSVVSIDKWFFGHSFHERWLPSKLFLYNFQQQIFMKLSFTTSVLEKQHVFIFAPIFIRNLMPTLYITSLSFMNIWKFAVVV